jgi:YARHG domain-containing protein
MKRPLALLLTVTLLLIAAHRLPAPIQEIQESPTPAPEQPRKTQELLSASQPSPSSTNAPNPLATSSATSSVRSFVTETGSNLSSVSAWPGEAFPETRNRRLKAEDITAWDAEKLRYAINEMYARGGYDFRTPEIKQIFMRLSWYRERLVNGRTQDEAYAHLSALERTNLELLQAARRGKQ